LDDLIEEIETVRHEVMELGERVDFAERMLARSNDPQELPKGGGDKPEEGPWR
jgi:hypothetical protein